MKARASSLDASGSSSCATESSNLRKAPCSDGGCSMSMGLLDGLDSLERQSTSILGLDGEGDLLLEGGGEAASPSRIRRSLSSVCRCCSRRCSRSRVVRPRYGLSRGSRDMTLTTGTSGGYFGMGDARLEGVRLGDDGWAEGEERPGEPRLGPAAELGRPDDDAPWEADRCDDRGGDESLERPNMSCGASLEKIEDSVCAILESASESCEDSLDSARASGELSRDRIGSIEG